MATLSATKGRLRWLLVLGLVLVPGAVLSVVTWRLTGQERELEASRRAERRALVAARIAQQLQSRLELARTNARALQTSGAVTPDSGVLVLVAPVTERGMAVPWEGSGTGIGETGEYPGIIAEGERLEFVRGRPDLAAERYRAASETAAAPAARLEAGLREARALSRAGRTDAALRTYAAVAEAPADVRDRDGMPLALYGAEGLLAENRASVDLVVDVLERVVDGGPGLVPPALYALRDLARSVAAVADSIPLADSDDAATTVGRLLRVEQLATERVALAEGILALRRDLPAVLSLAVSADPGSRRSPASATAGTGDSAAQPPLPSGWRPWGPHPWLVGVLRDGDRRLVLVADPERLLDAIGLEAAQDLGVALRDVSLSAVPGPDAELLGPAFPALFAILPDAALQGAGSSGFGRVLLVLVLPLVLAVTVLATVLLWRDVRREIETAGMRAQFVSSVSHELKTPLTSIRMYAQTLLMGRHHTEADRRTYLETIVNESERLTRLINNVLDFSRIERGGRSYRKEPISLASVVHDAAYAMSYPLEQGGFELHVRIPEEVPEIRCDGEALTQAVVNLLSNAVKFSGSAKVIELELACEDDSAAIRVHDHGLGIDRRHHDAVFERFFRTPEAESKGLPGTGLGLALVAHVAHAHGGAVELDSAPGRGSTFTIRLPLQPPPGEGDVSARSTTRTHHEVGPASDRPTSAASPGPRDAAGKAGRFTDAGHVAQ